MLVARGGAKTDEEGRVDKKKFRRMVKDVVRGADVDGSGELDRDELRKALDEMFDALGLTRLTKSQFKAYYRELDTDGNGSIDVFEAQTMVRHALEAGLVIESKTYSSGGSESSSSGRAARGKKKGKSSGKKSGKLAKGSDASAILANPVRLKQVAGKAFKKFDKSKTGVLSKAEVERATRKMFGDLGIEELESDEFDDLYAVIDADDNGELDSKEFKSLMQMVLEAAAHVSTESTDYSSSSSSCSSS